MGFFSVLAFIAAPVPTTAVYLGKKAKDYVSDRIEEGKSQAREEGRKAGESAASQKYQKKVSDLTDRLRGYHDFDKTVVGLYAVGLATANADGHIADEEISEINDFVAGCTSGKLPVPVKKTISELRKNPPTLEKAVEFARDAGLSKRDIQDVIDLVVMADDEYCQQERKFVAAWKQMAKQIEWA